MNRIIESAKFVADNSKHVAINNETIEEFCNYFNHSHIRHWLYASPFKILELNPKDRLHFLLVFNAISFSYWGDPKWKVKFHSKEVDGAYGMICALGKALKNGLPILDARYLSEIDTSTLGKILEGSSPIPLFEERLNFLKEIGDILLNKFEGDFANLVVQAKGGAMELLTLILKTFPLFNDEATYKGRKVYFYKKAQLLVSDIYQAFEGHTFGRLKNISELTACADYKLPFVLRRLEVLTYSDYLADKIDNQVPIEKESDEEIEIRANTIWAVELIKQKLKQKIPHADSIHVNDHLWMLGQKKFKNDKPYHHTRTTAY